MTTATHNETSTWAVASMMQSLSRLAAGMAHVQANLDVIEEAISAVYARGPQYNLMFGIDPEEWLTVGRRFVEVRETETPLAEIEAVSHEFRRMFGTLNDGIDAIMAVFPAQMLDLNDSGFRMEFIRRRKA